MAIDAPHANGAPIIHFAPDDPPALLLGSYASLPILSSAVATGLVLVTWSATAQNDELQYLN